MVDLARRLPADRFESHVLALETLGRGGAELAAEVGRHEARGQGGSILWPRGLIRMLRELQPDVVHTHSGVWYKASLAARLAGVPRVVHTDHGRTGAETWLDRRLERRASRRTDVVVAVSDALAEFLRRRILADPARLTVVLNGVETERFAPRSDDGVFRREVGLGPEVPLIGSIGRFDPIKGYEVMLHGFALLLAGWTATPAPRLVLAGEGPAEAELRALTHALGLESRVHFIGWRADVPGMHRALTLFSLSSHSEGTSISLLEAMSSGVCPLVTDVGGNRAVLGPALAHRLVPPRDAAALADAWRGALTDADARRRDAGAARARVLDAYTLDHMVRQYAALYAGARTGSGGPGA